MGWTYTDHEGRVLLRDGETVATWAVGYYVMNVVTGDAVVGPVRPAEADTRRLELEMAAPGRTPTFEVWHRTTNGEFRRASF